MDDFTPIDHKDSDAEYRAAVRAGIESSVGSKLVDIDSRDSVVGDWDLSFPKRPDKAPLRFSFLPDGTIRSPYDEPETPSDKWRVDPGTFTAITWCKPMPEYGMDEGTWTSETYHCAVTEDGSVVRWNGDGSLLVLFKRCSG